MCLCCWAQQAYDWMCCSSRGTHDSDWPSVFCAVIHQKLLSEESVRRDNCQCVSVWTLSAAVSNKFIKEMWFKSIKHAAGEHTQCWLMNGFSFMGHKQHSLSHHMGRTSKDAKKESAQLHMFLWHKNISDSRVTFLQNHEPSKMFPKFGQFGWSKFRFLHIFSYPQTQMSTVAKSMHGSETAFTLWTNCNVRKIEAARTNEK